MRRSQAAQPLTAEQVERMRAWMLQHRTRRDATLLSVLAYSGLRPGEAMGLAWRHV